jgi:methionine synthase II (cobalamin-independent)
MNYALSKTATMVKPTPITIPTEPIGRIPRPVDLIERVKNADSEDPKLAPLYDVAVRDTIERFAGAGSPVVTDGEQRKHHNFCTYCVHAWTSEHGTGWLHDSVLGRSYAPPVTAHARPLPLPKGTQTLGGTVNL